VKNTKKIISLFLALCMAFSITASVSAGSVFSDVSDDAAFWVYAKLLNTLGILSGDGDGTLRPYDNITRAEFAKLAVCVLDKQGETVSTSGASSYKDVAPDHWAVKYINYVSKNGIILGYPDGSFHPEENISFAQAVTVTLRMLGYTGDDIGDFWPDNYIQKAQALGLTDSLDYGYDTPITRGDCAILLGRGLEAEMKSSTPASKKTLIDNFGYEVIDEVTLISSYENDKSLSADRIKTSQATYKTLTNDVFDMIGSVVKLYLDDEKRIILALPQKQASYTLTIKKAVGDGEYVCISDTGEIEYTFDKNLTMYYEGKSGNYSSFAQYFESGAVVTLKGSYDGVWEYAMLDGATKITPVIASRDMSEGDTSISGITIKDPSTLRVYRDGYSASLSQIKRNDVIYYNPTTNIMDVYIDKVTGTYDKALPNKANVTSIELGGKTFAIETRAAQSKLDESASSFKINDRITLLLGKNGDIAGVVNVSNDLLLDYAVLVSSDSQLSTDEADKGKLVQKATVMQTDGQMYTYTAKKDYSDYEGSLVKMSFDGGVISLVKVHTNDLSGYIDKNDKTINGKTIADGAALFDLAKTADGSISVKKLELSDIKKASVEKGDVIAYAITSAFGDIGVILFDDISDSNTQYGILTSRDVKNNASSISGTYVVNVRGTETKYTTNSAFSQSVGTPVKISVSGKSLSSMVTLTKVGSGNSVAAIDYNRIKVGTEVYKMDEDVVIYRMDPTSREYVTMSQNDILSSRVLSVELWADASVNSGGIVRVIKVSYKAN